MHVCLSICLQQQQIARIQAYTYCITEKHGINPGCDHAVLYPGYVSGRFLVNLNDSVRTSIDKVSATDKSRLTLCKTGIC